VGSGGAVEVVASARGAAVEDEVVEVIIVVDEVGGAFTHGTGPKRRVTFGATSISIVKASKCFGSVMPLLMRFRGR